MDVSLWHSKWTILIFGYILTIVGSAFLCYGLQIGRHENFFEQLENIKLDTAWRWFVFLPIIAVAFVPPLVKLYVFGKTLPEFFPITLGLLVDMSISSAGMEMGDIVFLGGVFCIGGFDSSGCLSGL